VGRGPGAAQLGVVVGEHPDQDVQYLDTTKSCTTAWIGDDRPAPRYVAYVGPFDTRADACDAQFRSGRPGGIVTVLKPETTDTVQCLCYIRLARPTLHRGMSTDGSNGIWVRHLQSLLVDMGLAAAGDSPASYDSTTATTIRRYQADHGLPATGIVDADTWTSLMHQGCKLYSS
jgi:hypothetical protein